MAIEADEVLKIKPSLRIDHDVLAWAHEKNGFYSVWSAYHLLKHEQTASAMAASSETAASESSQSWSSLWKLDIPPKVRVFWWRVLHNSLPSKSELKRRHVTAESYCETCGDPDETLYHVFFQCPLAKRFWAEVKSLLGVAVPNLPPWSWASEILKVGKGPPNAMATVTCGAWALWTRRNGRRHGRKTWEPGATARYISKLMEDLSSLKQPSSHVKQKVLARWEKPEMGWAKVNTDAGFDHSNCSGSSGVVIRDNEGLVAAAAARWLEDVSDSLSAEAMAAKEGLELAQEIGLNRVILEVDSQELVNMLKNLTSFRSSIGGLCFDISELGRSFSEFDVKWVRREANMVAHVCAATVSALERSFFWIDFVPDWLVSLAAADCTPVMN